jgi:hypothetical protein
MQSSIRNVLVLSALAGAAAIASGCEGAKQTEYVAGISTQVQVPRDLRTIRIDIAVGGSITFCRSYKVYDGRVQLPRSLGAFPVRTDAARLAEPVTVTVTGFTEEVETGNQIFDCIGTVTPGENARILRRSRQPYVKDEILFLPLALRYSCFDKDCESGTSGEKTCKGGRCVDAVIDPRALPRFSHDLVDGTGASCFNARLCLGRDAETGVTAAPAAISLNAEDCTYGVLGSKDLPPPAFGDPPPAEEIPNWEGVNVEITYDGGASREILDKDPDEGFVVFDPNKPQQFRLAPGLCDMVRGYDAELLAQLEAEGDPDAMAKAKTKHRITAVRASGTCRAKSPYQPLCEHDQLAAMGVGADGVAPGPVPASCTATELTPAASVLMVLVDDTDNHSIFFTGKGDDTAQGPGQTADSVLVNLALDDPAFSQTDVGLTFFPGGADASTCEPITRAVEPAISRTAKKDIVELFAARAADPSILKPAGTPVDLRAALDDTFALLESAAFSSYHKRAVVVLGNRGFAGNAPPAAACGGSPEDRAAAAHASGIGTYVVLLARDDDTQPPPTAEQELGPAHQLALAGGSEGAYDARTDKLLAQQGFQKLVADIATCAYDAPAALAPQTPLTYSDPVLGTTHTIAHDPACTEAGDAGNGWAQDGAGRVYLCGDACGTYRTVLQTAAAFAAQHLQPSLAVPLFAHEPGCAP